MSEDKPRQRIDWNGEEDNQTAIRVPKPKNMMRLAAVPATVGLVGLALIGALAAGPLMRGLASQDRNAPETAIDTIHTADAAPVAIAAPEVSAESPVKRPKAEAAPDPAVEPKAAASAKPQAGTAELAAGSPRWNPDALAVDESKLSSLKEAVRETVAAAEIANAIGASGDLLASKMPVQAAGFAPERPSAPPAERSAFDAALVSVGDDETAASDTSGLEPARAKEYVNMRAAPSDDADVVAVVPANASIEAEVDCRWCEVSYDGKTGYIFQRFIARN